MYILFISARDEEMKDLQCELQESKETVKSQEASVKCKYL